MQTNPLQYSFYTLIDIRFADPVSAIGMNEKFISTGTMMGRIALLSIPEKKTILLAELSSENITGITFEANDIFSIAIGDDEVLRYQFDTGVAGQSSIPSCTRIKNYSMESDHNSHCEACYTLLSNYSLFRIFLHHPEEGNLNIQKMPSGYEVKNLRTYEADTGEIEMTNYSVPFDYDGERFTWVEFLSEKERNICVFFVTNKSCWKFALTREFGHISHCKLLPNNRMFIVRNLVQCEIREQNSSFSVLQSFTHIGDEVIAADIYVHSKNLMNEMELDNVQVNKNVDLYIKIPGDKSIPREKELVNINQPEENQKISDENISILLVDIDGNVNVWENLGISTKFNMYELSDINKEYKEKQFFSMGYPYYIKMNTNFYAITTDHGTFVIKKN